MNISILGGGLKGLPLVYFLEKNYRLFEKESEFGGLCRTFNKGGFLRRAVDLANKLKAE